MTRNNKWVLFLALSTVAAVSCTGPDRNWDENTFPEPDTDTDTLDPGDGDGDGSGGDVADPTAGDGDGDAPGDGDGDGSGGDQTSGDGDGDGSGGDQSSGDGDGDNPACEDGFTGDLCDQCDPDHFGDSCEPCPCPEGTCSDGKTGNGTCTCSPGFADALCTECKTDHFGPNCEQCACENGTCDDGVQGSGACECNTGWNGDTCSECKTGFFGPSCTLCECGQGSCDDGLSGSGSCSCENGWAEPNCSDCSSNFWGSSCTACNCGGGTCSDGLEGNGDCFSCSTGFQGTACDQCQSNRYGSTCALCSCEHGDCDEGITGSGACDCDTGWDGNTCNVCETGYYGNQCVACPSTPTASCPCTGSGTSCAGNAQKVRLSCTNSKWAVASSCGGGQNCDTRNGSCANIVSGCNSQNPGYKFCEAPDKLHTCGADLVTTDSITCDGLCSAGSCLAPKCGDTKIQASLSEECDDGNTNPGDGCEPDCKRSKVVKVAVGGYHACVLTGRGDVRCWGDNTYNQLGLGHTNLRTNVHPYQNALVDLGGVATDVVAGANHTCALLSDKSIRCWGRNQNGQLGLGNTTVMSTQLPVTIGAISVGGMVNQIAASSNQTCARLSTGALRCWGNNSLGQLGLGNTTPVSETTLPSALSTISIGGNATDVAVGGTSVCAVLSGGVRCWGSNSSGQLGRQHAVNIGDTELPNAVDPNVPAGFDNTGLVAPAPGLTISKVFGTGNHYCALLSNQTLECWGSNTNGELGLASSAPRLADGPGEAPALNGLVQLGVGVTATQLSLGGDSTCVVHSTGELKCWGYNNTAELGLADTNRRGVTEQPPSMTASILGSGLTASYVGAGLASTCLLHSNGRVRCWGSNTVGQLGLGYASAAPDYMGGDPSQTPDKLAFLLLFNSAQ